MYSLKKKLEEHGGVLFLCEHPFKIYQFNTWSKKFIKNSQFVCIEHSWKKQINFDRSHIKMTTLLQQFYSLAQMNDSSP